MIIIGLLAIHLFFFMGFQYQLLQILDELAFPSDDPIMTSTLEEPNNPDIFEYEENTTVLEEEPEVFEYAEPKDIMKNLKCLKNPKKYLKYLKKHLKYLKKYLRRSHDARFHSLNPTSLL